MKYNYLINVLIYYLKKNVLVVYFVIILLLCYYMIIIKVKVYLTVQHLIQTTNDQDNFNFDYS